MYKYIFTVITLLFIVSSQTYAEENANNMLVFKKIFSNWSQAFNHKNLKESCDLFSKNLVADYQGVPQKNYQSVCDGFKKIFSLKNQIYQYNFRIHHVYLSERLAAVRITWYLRHYEKGKLINVTQDEGLDIFEKNSSDKWKIINYLAYKSREI